MPIESRIAKGNELKICATCGNKFDTPVTEGKPQVCKSCGWTTLIAPDELAGFEGT